MTDNSIAPAASFPAILRELATAAPLRAAVLIVLFAALGIAQTRTLAALASPGLWRHLSAGTWILQNHSVPRHLLFSQNAGLAWVDSSWLFDVLIAAVYKIFGLRGLPFLQMAITFCIAIALFLLARGARRAFWSGALLSAIALYLFAAVPLRSSLSSVLLFAIELGLLAAARSSGNFKKLYWLPPLFLLWANLDIQFVYGLMTLLLGLVAIAVEAICRQSNSAWRERFRVGLPVGRFGVITALSFVATLSNPYGFQLWGAALRSVSVFAADMYFPEMHSLRFRQPHDYLLLLLVMSAFLALGRKQGRDLFSVVLLSASSVISFHIQRDAWLVTLVAVAVLAQALDDSAPEEIRDAGDSTPRRVLPAAAVCAMVLLIAAFAMRVPADRDTLLAKVGEKFPVRASDYIRHNELPKPLFNTYDWGSFLTWYLPEYPVAIDSRSDAYGEDLTMRYFSLMTGQVPINADPSLSQAGTIFLEADSELGKALSILPGFHRVYLDDQAMVLVREN